MPIVCEPAASARQLVPGVDGDVRVADTPAAVAELLAGDPAETLVVIGPEIPLDQALTFAASLRLARPIVGVILVRYQVDVILLTQALQAGVREVVPARDAVALAAACRRSHEISRRMRAGTPAGEPGAEPPMGKIITVFAAKGGCGKTTVTVNLGIVLARSTGRRVCVVDLDLAFGDVAMCMQLDPVRTLADAVPMAGRLDVAGAASLLTRYEHGVEVLLAPLTPGEAEKVPASLAGEMLAVLGGMFDYVVIDTPPHLSEHVLTAMDASHHHVLLTTLDVLAVKNLRVALDTLDLLSYPRENRSVILNRSDSKVRLSAQDVERALHCRLSAHIPSSRAVPNSINKGVPIAKDSPGHPVSQAIALFAQQYLLPRPLPQRGQRGQRGPFRRRGRRRPA